MSAADIIRCPRCSHACGNTVDRATGRTLRCQFCGYPDTAVDEGALGRMSRVVREAEAACILLGHEPGREVFLTNPPRPLCQHCGLMLAAPATPTTGVVNRGDHP